MWNSYQWRNGAAFTFSDTEGRFGAFLMRLDGLHGNAQGYTRLFYHLDVKVADAGSFVLSQSELDRVSRTTAPDSHAGISLFWNLTNYRE